jgi:hypothetical protein
MTNEPFIAYDGTLLPLDLDGDPYRTLDTLGAWKVTPCCGAVATGTESDIACKHCWNPVENDGPARLPTQRSPA